MTPGEALTRIKSIVENLTDADGVDLFAPDNVVLSTEPTESYPFRGPLEAHIRYDGHRPHRGHGDEQIFANITIELRITMEPVEEGEGQLTGAFGVAGLLDTACRIQAATYHLRQERGEIVTWVLCTGCSNIRSSGRRTASCTLSYEAQLSLLPE